MGQRLIDAEALRADYCGDCPVNIRTLCGKSPACADMKFIFNAPTVDAVPVVRCEKCRKFKTCECPMAATAGYSDFCSYGERKED